MLQLSSQSLESSQRKSDKSNKSDDSNTQACQQSIENNCSDVQFQDTARDDSIIETEHQNSEQSSSIENNGSDVQFQDTRLASDDSNTKCHDTKLGLSELIEFLKREDTTKTLKNFIDSHLEH